jgi:hypothetical protein
VPTWFASLYGRGKSYSLCLGLSKVSSRQRRRSADDSGLADSNGSDRFNDDLANLHDLDELKEIIRNQRKFTQQLQMRLRLNTPDIIQSPTLEKLNEQNRVKISPVDEALNDIVPFMH